MIWEIEPPAQTQILYKNIPRPYNFINWYNLNIYKKIATWSHYTTHIETVDH